MGFTIHIVYMNDLKIFLFKKSLLLEYILYNKFINLI